MSFSYLMQDGHMPQESPLPSGSMTRLRQLKTDKTIPYIRDIRMLDLSEENPQG